MSGRAAHAAGRGALRCAVLIVATCPAFVWTRAGEAIHVAHYNMLASYLGDNREPWFLLPLNLSGQERDAVLASYYEKSPEGEYQHGFADGFGGALSLEQRRLVEGYQDHFRWSSRRPRIMDLVRGWKADLFSIVEMDRFEEFREELSDVYEGAFAKRPRRKSRDGSSLFWRRARFELVGCPRNVTFQDWEPCHDRVHHEDRVMLVAALRDRADGGVFVVASVHLMRNPEDKGKDPLRMLEVSQMMRALSCFMGEVDASGLILMGDFNAVPESFTHLFLLHGWQDCPAADKGVRDAFDDCCWNRTGVCTTRTAARSVWIDYIFYSGRTMELVEPPPVEPCPDGAIPDAEHPSDHLPVRASLRLADAALAQGAAGHKWIRPGLAGSCVAGPSARPPGPSETEACDADGLDHSCSRCEQG